MAWSLKQDRILWPLYRNGDVDCNNNDPEYLFNIATTYFPGVFNNRESAIKRLRQKNANRRAELALLAGQAQAPHGE
jgi:hypothetical protein